MFEVAMISLNIQIQDPNWYLDSRATKHIIGDLLNMFEITTYVLLVEKIILLKVRKKYY